MNFELSNIKGPGVQWYVVNGVIGGDLQLKGFLNLLFKSDDAVEPCPLAPKCLCKARIGWKLKVKLRKAELWKQTKLWTGLNWERS